MQPPLPLQHGAPLVACGQASDTPRWRHAALRCAVQGTTIACNSTLLADLAAKLPASVSNAIKKMVSWVPQGALVTVSSLI